MSLKFIAVLACSIFAFGANAGVIRVAEGDFLSGSGLITFSEVPINTINPIYDPSLYGGDMSDPTVTFGGFFMGQMLSMDPANDCPGAAASACIVGNPTGPLTLDPNSPDTFVVNDGANPTSPVLSGTPTFNGGIALLFSTDQFGVGFDAGFFDDVGSTAITAFDRNGNLLGSVSNVGTGIEFLGLVDDGNVAVIAGVFLDLVGPESAGFAIDNIRFGQRGEIDIPPTNDVNAPSMGLALLLTSTLMLIRRRKQK